MLNHTLRKPCCGSQHETAPGRPEPLLSGTRGGWSLVFEHRGADLGEVLVHPSRDLAVTFRRGLYSQAPQQLGGRGARVAALAEYRMQALIGEVVEH